MKELLPHQQAEQCIQKKFRAKLWSPFVRAIRQYQLIKEGDEIAVCISGGKDSMLLAKLMQALQRYSTFPFGLRFLVMDPGYNQANLDRIKQNAQLLDIPIEVFQSDIFSVVERTDRSPCYLCARMRRGYLYSKAQQLGCNKIALGHHFSDVVETVLMGMLYGAQFQTMLPKLHSQNFQGMELIRPLYCIHEDDIIRWQKYNSLEFIACACHMTQRTAQGTDVGKRQQTKLLLRELRKTIPDVEHHIFMSTHMVNLSTILGYKKGSVQTSFLDDYDSASPNEVSPETT